MTILLDANILVRIITNDDTKAVHRIVTYLEKIEDSSTELLLTYPVLCEIIYVLSGSVYSYTRKEVSLAISHVLAHPLITASSKQICLQALDLFIQHNIDFEDCLLAAQNISNKEIHGILSLDTDFKKIPEVNLVEL